MKYISIIAVLLAIVYFYMMKQENTNTQPYTQKDKATSSSSLSERIKQKPIDVKQQKNISQKIAKMRKQTKLDESQYKNIFSFLVPIRPRWECIREPKLPKSLNLY